MTWQKIIIAVCIAFLSGPAGISTGARAEDPAAQRQEHEQAVDKKLKELNKNMNELAAGFKKTEGQARDELNSLYEEFKKKQASANKDLEKMRKSTDESWDKAKVQMNKAIEDLNGIYERAKTGSKKEKESPDRTK